MGAGRMAGARSLGIGYRGVMPGDDDHEAGRPVPARYPATPDTADSRPRPGPAAVARDGASWPLGTAADVAWIADGTTIDTTITSAIPAVFDAYATVVLPEDAGDQRQHDEAVMSVLCAHSENRPWWLGYLDTGADDVVFPDAPRVSLYSQWPYVLVQAGPGQAAAWRRWDHGSFWFGHLPNLMFPTDRAWLASTLWDDDWTCVGGPAALVESLLRHPGLRHRCRRVEPGEVATPPGHRAA